MNRLLTQQEKSWLIRGLNTLATGEYFGGGRWVDTKTNKTKKLDKPINPEFFIEQIENLRVIGSCNCGEANCHTVQFQNFEIGKLVNLVFYNTEDKRMLLIHINEDTNQLAELEII